MTTYHAVMCDETGCEFGVSVKAKSRAAAYEALHEDYPESRVVQVETGNEVTQRQRRVYRAAQRAYDEGY